MVLLSASICTKTGKALVGRQFMDMTRSRVEGLLAAFPKLINTEEQHTFVETDTVRYVYQPMESLFMVLITTKNSNILEDLETLRLFAKVVPEYCRDYTEAEVSECAFELIFAFDEIVALGYRENVNLSQIRTFTEMDSHDENVAKMIKKNKENEQKEIMKRKAKEIAMTKRLASTGMSGISNRSSAPTSDFSGSSNSPSSSDFNSAPAPAPAPAPTRTAKKAGGMKLGKKGKKETDFEAKLAAEGQAVKSFGDQPADDSPSVAKVSARAANAPPEVEKMGVHFSVDEKITLEANRDGGLENMEVKGLVYCLVSDPAYSKIRVNASVDTDKSIPFQTHPNVDKKLWNAERVIKLKSGKPFPNGTEVSVVKWRFQTTDESLIPLTINCWPTVNANGSADVNIDFELVDTTLKLSNVTITVPVPGAPTVHSVDGEYNHDRRDQVLEWTIPEIDSENAEGSMEFTVTDVQSADNFFPVAVDFSSSQTYAGITIDSVELDDGSSVEYSSEVSFDPATYEYI